MGRWGDVCEFEELNIGFFMHLFVYVGFSLFCNYLVFVFLGGGVKLMGKKI